MLDETNPAEESATPAGPQEASPDVEAAPAPAKKAAAKKTAAKKAPAKKAAKKSTAKKAAAPADVPAEVVEAAEDEAPAKKAAAKKTAAKKAPAKKAAKKSTAKKATAKKAVAEAHAGEVPPVDLDAPTAAETPVVGGEVEQADEAPVKKAAAKKTAAKKAPAKKAAAKKAAAKKTTAKKATEAVEPEAAAEAGEADGPAGTLPIFQAPEPVKKAPARRTRKKVAPVEEAPAEADETDKAVDPDAVTAEADSSPAEVGTAELTESTEESTEESTAGDDDSDDSEGDEENGEGTPTRRRRRRGGRRRRRSSSQSENGDGEEGESSQASSDQESADEGSSDEAESEGAGEGSSTSSRRRRRRRRSSDNDSGNNDDPENTVTRVRQARAAEDQITALAGSTRLEAKKQRRREGREAGRRRAPIVSEAEFLARRESVDRVMVIRQRADLTQIAVLEDRVLVEHYVAKESQTSLIGNVYLGRVQNVLPSMEAAFIDIGKGRNAVLYAGEVNWSALGHKDGQARKIESVLSPGQPVLVQVTKDPVGHKGARLTSQISLAGRFLVYVPDGTNSGISRKLPDTERARLKSLLKEIVPDSAGVIVRTAAEGASEDELTRDVERLKARWEDIESKKKGNGPQLLYGEPDLTLKVVRDLFTEDFSKLVIEGDDAWETVQGYVEHVAPDLADRLERYEPADNASAQQGDVFSVYRIDEQIAKGLDRKVWLPSGGSLVIDRTEAMTVVDVNTGKFTGSGGNLEETVTKNNLEAAEEIVRQLRLRDIGGIIVVDFIDMVLEANRDLVVRRLVECLGRDRTRHQVAEVTSLGLVQMTRKRIGTGLLETFATDCEHCNGRGLVTHSHPVESRSGGGDDDGRRGRRGRGRSDKQGDKQTDRSSDKQGDRNERGGRGQQRKSDPASVAPTVPSPIDVAAVARQDNEPIIPPEAPEAPEESAPAASVEQESTPVDTSPKLVTRTRSRRGGTRADSGRTDEQSAAPVETSAPVQSAPVESTPVESAGDETTPVDTSPKLVTRTRTRRGASRPTTVAPPVVVEVPAAEAAPVVPTAAEPGAAPAKPQVVTRTRSRRSAQKSSSASAGGSDGAGEAQDEPSVEHVPVKKKGTRKR